MDQAVKCKDCIHRGWWNGTEIWAPGEDGEFEAEADYTCPFLAPHDREFNRIMEDDFGCTLGESKNSAKCVTCYWNGYDRADASWQNCEGCPKNPQK